MLPFPTGPEVDSSLESLAICRQLAPAARHRQLASRTPPSRCRRRRDKLAQPCAVAAAAGCSTLAAPAPALLQKVEDSSLAPEVPIVADEDQATSLPSEQPGPATGPVEVHLTQTLQNAVRGGFKDLQPCETGLLLPHCRHAVVLKCPSFVMQLDFREALALLQNGVSSATAQYAMHASGLLRFEVRCLPRHKPSPRVSVHGLAHATRACFSR